MRRELCISCTNNTGCTFPRKLPVLHCEEFSDYVAEPSGRPALPAGRPALPAGRPKAGAKKAAAYEETRQE